MAKNYSGSDLSPQDKKRLRGYISEIRKILNEKSCTNIDFSYGFHYLSGFFTAKDGQMYYIMSRDTRFGCCDIIYRTVKSYRDFTGGMNHNLNSIQELKNINF